MSKTVSTIFGTFSDEELKVLRSSVEQLSDVMTMMEAQRDTQKEIINEVYDKLKIPKKIIRRIAKTYHKRTFEEESTENTEFEALYEGVEGKS